MPANVSVSHLFEGNQTETTEAGFKNTLMDQNDTIPGSCFHDPVLPIKIKFIKDFFL